MLCSLETGMSDVLSKKGYVVYHASKREFMTNRRARTFSKSYANAVILKHAYIAKEITEAIDGTVVVPVSIELDKRALMAACLGKK